MTTPELILNPAELTIVKEILTRLLPDREVRAFGSRVNGRPKKFSDLDLAITGSEPIPLSTMANLRDAFTNSDLPYKVDIVDLATTTPDFRLIIQESCSVVQNSKANDDGLGPIAAQRVLSAEELFSKTFGRFVTNWSVVMSLRQVAEHAVPLAPQVLAPFHAEAADFIATKLIISLNGDETFVEGNGRGLIQAALTETTMSNAHRAIDAASLVFAQSMLDDCALSYCRVCALISPEDWETFFEAKKIKFSSVRSESFQTIRNELVKAKLDQLARESLLSKVDILFILCRPPKDFAPMRNYVFDRQRLEVLDTKRHQIIHGNGLMYALENLDEDLTFIQKTGQYLMGLLQQRYGLRVDPNKIVSRTADTTAATPQS